MLNIGIVGTGSRGYSFAEALANAETAKNRARLVALCDVNPKRLQAAKELYGGGAAAETHIDYGEFLARPDLDAVIVTTPCDTHAELAIRALESGRHVLCEKAMALTPSDLDAMLAAEEKSGKRMQLGLCLRYADFMKDLIPIVRRGDIGDVIFVTAVETLEGSNHFNRWHRDRKQSGGILLQKGTHTMDLINWIVDERPKTISAIGGRDVYAPRDECAGRRCLDCPEKRDCDVFLDIERDERTIRLYKECEDADGYIWDRCVFDPAADIHDNVLVQIEYEGGKRASYAISLFHEPPEGIEREFVILGTKGRIDVSRRREEIIVRRRRSKDVIRYNLEGHGEGFEAEMDDFLTMVETGRKPVADSHAGYWSALEGIAAERSIAEGRTLSVAKLVKA